MPSLSGSQKSCLAPPNLCMNSLNIPELITSVTVSVTLTDVWSCSPIVRVRVVLRRNVIDWQQFFHRPIRWPPPDLSKRWTLVPKITTGAKLRRGKLPVPLDRITGDLWCHWSRERKQISRISFSSRKWKVPLPPCPAIYPKPSLL